MRKLPDWSARLDVAVAAARHRPFSWDVHHCGSFAASCVDAMTGDQFAAVIGGFDGPFAAAHWLKAEGGLPGAVTRRLGVPTDAVVERGDVVLLLSGRPAWARALGVCVGPGMILAAGDAGLELRSSADALLTWRLEPCLP